MKLKLGSLDTVIGVLGALLVVVGLISGLTNVTRGGADCGSAWNQAVSFSESCSGDAFDTSELMSVLFVSAGGVVLIGLLFLFAARASVSEIKRELPAQT